MKKTTLLIVAFWSVAFFGLQTASAQIPSRLKTKIRIPQPNQPEPAPETKPAAPSAPAATTKPESETAPAQPQPESRIETKPAADEGPDQPTIAKDSVHISAWTNNSYRGNYDHWSWVPMIKFRVNGPIPSGSQLYVEFTQPGGSAPWVKFDCDTGEAQKGYWWKTECGGRQVEDKSTTAVGPVSFTIKMRNELAGTNSTIYTGRIRVAKTLSNEHGPKAANKFVYYIDQDWTLPIGYVFYTPGPVYGWQYPNFNLAFWVRGEAVRFDPHLFFQGKEIGRVFSDGTQIGRASCGSTVDIATTHYVNDSMPQKAKWSLVECSFPMVKQWDKTEGGQPNSGEMFMMAANPGEYEFKLLWNNKLARSIRFTVGPDGKLENGIAPANKLGSDRVIVPVTIIGDQDGQWNRAAWKTEAFYGNPLTGFTPPQ